MQKQCEQCGKDFEAERGTAKFCSGACKLNSSRGKKPIANHTAVVKATDKKQTITTSLLTPYEQMRREAYKSMTHEEIEMAGNRMLQLVYLQKWNEDEWYCITCAKKLTEGNCYCKEHMPLNRK